MIGAPRAAAMWNAAQRDRFFSNVSLLLHCDGTNGSTSFPDSSKNNTSVTVTGGITLSTTNSKFGTACLLGVGSNGYISAAYKASAVLGSNDFTVEFWINPISIAAGGIQVFSNYNVGTNLCFAIYITTAGQIQLYVATGGTTWNILNGAVVGTISNNVWSHVSVCRSGNTYYGSVGGTVTNLGTVAGTIGNPSLPYYIAGSPLAPGPYEINGRMDDVRLTIGTARYTATFTPPALPFPNF